MENYETDEYCAAIESMDVALLTADGLVNVQVRSQAYVLESAGYVCSDNCESDFAVSAMFRSVSCERFMLAKPTHGEFVTLLKFEFIESS